MHVSSGRLNGKSEESSFHKIGRVSHLNYLTQDQRTDFIELGAEAQYRIRMVA